MRHHTTLLLAALALAPAPWNARAAESGRKEAPLKVSLVPGKMALVQDEPLCLNVTLTATRETGMVRPKFSGHGRDLQLFIAKEGEEKRRIDWEDSWGLKQAVIRLKAGEQVSHHLCISWDLASNAFPLAEAGRYTLSAHLHVQLEGPRGNMAAVDLSSPEVQVQVGQPPSEAREAYALMEQLGAMIRAQKYGKPLRKPLIKIVEEHPDTPYARFAAWAVARVWARKNQDFETTQRMVHFLELATRNSPQDRITEESLRLLLSLYNDLDQLDKARECAALYLRLFPSGRYAEDIVEFQHPRN